MVGMRSKEWEKRDRVSTYRWHFNNFCYIGEQRNGAIARGRNEILKRVC